MTDKKLDDAAKRRMLKGTALAGGAFAAAQWQKPIVGSALLPAHAGTTIVMAEGFDSQGGISVSITFPPVPGPGA